MNESTSVRGSVTQSMEIQMAQEACKIEEIDEFAGLFCGTDDEVFACRGLTGACHPGTSPGQAGESAVDCTCDCVNIRRMSTLEGRCLTNLA